MTEQRQPSTLQHYDLSPRIFELFLDPAMKYSSGLFLSPEDSLERAQLQKMDFVARELRLRGGERVLDLGCGWGSLTCFLAEKLGCSVHGITPSPRQAARIRERAAAAGTSDRIEVSVGYFHDMRLAPGTFDAVAMLGSIVHMRDKKATVAEALRLLRPGGRLYLSESCFRNAAREKEFAERPGTLFVRDEIFGWGELLPMSRYIGWIEDAGFSLSGLTDLTEHYYHTIERWRENALSNREALEAEQPGITDRLVRYFEISNAGWGYTTKHYAVTAVRAR